MNKPSPQIAIIGAGPKALALAMKNQILSRLGFRVPTLHIFEKHHIAAHWRGQQGFTHGDLLLGTNPEKDLGFPYQCAAYGESDILIQEQARRYSWSAFLCATKQYAAWIDRHRPAPTHQQWADYLQWVAAQLSDACQFHMTAVTKIKLLNSGWQLESNNTCHYFDSLMLTGPGAMVDNIHYQAHPRILTPLTFWQALKQLPLNATSKLAIIGNGENAASMLMALRQLYPPTMTIDLMSHRATLLTRGESYFENRLYSQPQTWQQLTLEQRQQFINHTDRGVFSPQAMQILAQDNYLTVKPTTVTALKCFNDSCYVQSDSTTIGAYDYVLIANGFSQVAALHQLCDSATFKHLQRLYGNPTITDHDLSLMIDQDLSLKNLSAKLHLPMLAGLQQGPGFANLSCLGLLADRVLNPYIKQQQFNTRHKNFA